MEGIAKKCGHFSWISFFRKLFFPSWNYKLNSRVTIAVLALYWSDHFMFGQTSDDLRWWRPTRPVRLPLSKWLGIKGGVFRKEFSTFSLVRMNSRLNEIFIGIAQLKCTTKVNKKRNLSEHDEKKIQMENFLVTYR